MTVGEIVLKFQDEYGYPGSARYENKVKRWVNETLRQMQLEEQHKRRFLVFDAPFALIADRAEYDVRDSAADGGFGWDNCAEVVRLQLPDVGSVPMETLTAMQFRDRGSNWFAQSGQPFTVVVLDQFRVLFAPTPTQAYTGVGDFYQDVPTITEGKLSWPRMWDEVLVAGVASRAAQDRYKTSPAVWGAFEQRYQSMLSSLRLGEANQPTVPRRAVNTRAMRSRRVIVADNSADIRWRR